MKMLAIVCTFVFGASIASANECSMAINFLNTQDGPEALKSKYKDVAAPKGPGIVARVDKLVTAIQNNKETLCKEYLDGIMYYMKEKPKN